MGSEKRPDSTFKALPDHQATGVMASPTHHEPSITRSSEDGLAHLPPNEREIIKRQIEIKPSAVTYLTLFRFATKLDFFILAGSSLAAVAGGTALPLMTVVFGNLAGTFSQYSQNTINGAAGSDAISGQSLYMVYIGIGEFVTIYLAVLGFIFTGQRITQRTREEYLRAIMRQNIGFFDAVGAGEITKRITTDTTLVQDGISEKVALTVIALSIFVTAFVVGFIKSWELTLVMFSTVGIILVSGGVGAIFMVRYSKQSLEAYSGGGTIAQEVIGSIRSTTAFSIQEKLAGKYRSHLQQARKWEVKKKVTLALLIACIQWTASANDGLAYWQGARFLVSGRADVSAIVAIAANILIGALSLGAVGPYIENFTTAIAAGNKIYSTIDRESPLDPLSSDGQRPADIRGVIELRNIRHIYPSRPEVVALQDMNLHIPSGRTTALVGASGSGKSTIVGLLERFYDPVGGDVYLDGINVRDINLRFLRQQMALVSQEPTLFNTTIEANIAFGLLGSSSEGAGPEKRRQLVVEAAKTANAHGFITQLPQQYETNVGEFGALMSGGQKQRIAIARAVIGNPKILILDEATSALDTTSESIVQAALDRAAQGRTTIVVAHRLSTIKHAENIVVMDRGSIVEQGRHDALLERRGAYYALVTAQQVAAGKQMPAPIAELAEAEDGIERPFAINPNRRYITSVSSIDPLSSTVPISRSMSSASIVDPDPELAQPCKSTEQKRTEKKKSYSLWQSIKFIASFNKEERGLALIGLLASIIAGCCYPASVIFLAKCITTLFLPQSQYGELVGDISFWAAMFFMLAWVNLFSTGAQGVIFAYCSERLTYRARDRAFRTILRQDVGFFDAEENTSGALTSFLFTETTLLAGMSGATLGTILTFAFTLIASLSLGIAIGWKLGLVYTSCVPVLFAAGFFRLWMLARFATRANKENEKSASQACEATAAIRTVASLTLENEVCETYGKHLAAQRQKAFASIAKTSTLYAFSQSALLWCMALGFWYGGTLIVSGEYDTLQLFICLAAIIIGAQGSGVIFSFAPDMGKAKHAAEALQALFDRIPKIDIWSDAGGRIDAVKGAIRLQNVHFHYPTRPEQQILRGLDLSVKPGQFVALVGTSGCGKSTIIQLLERFYDPTSGSVFVDGSDISQLNVNDYRSFLALVSQEPALYDGTIKENIMLGAAIDEGQITEETIMQACKDANIYDFIISLPDGLNTLVGSKGSMLSGGQKQRVAIARALIRNPRILLLDEATSALDSESEKVVQTALDQAARGRTTIAVAHRLSTIQHADVIYVIDRGQVAEAGNHQELLSKGGQYADLVKLQSLEQRSIDR